jgi:beta-glucosidase
LVTQKSIVLLKNSTNLLPLNKSSVKSIAILGPRSDEVYEDWYSGTPGYSINPLQGIKNKIAAGTVISHSKNDNMAVSMAKAADVAIVFIGNHPTGNGGWAKVSHPSEGKEAVDREEINLEPSQEELVKRVYAANPNTLVVLVSSFPYAINWVQANIPSILHVTHNSQELGSALADVIFGDVNPAGRLVQTWPKSLAQLPPMMDYNIRNGRTYMYMKEEPLYPFGFGLSYTSFNYSNLKTSQPFLNRNGDIAISIDVKNTGSRAGDEVVQLYVNHIGSKVQRPIKELKGFQRISLNPNETKTVTIPLKASNLAYWDVKSKKFIVEKDRIQVQIGSSSSHIHAQKIININ